MKNHKLLAPIVGLFVAALLITNALDTKMFTVAGLNLPAGIIIFPLVYIFGDMLTEVYGYAVARRVIWTGFTSLVLMVICLEIAMRLPPASFWPNDAAFNTVFAQLPRLVTASFIAYFCGEFVNSYIIAKLKVKTDGRALAGRFVASTIGGQFVDTAVFIGVAFVGTMPFADLFSVFMSGWLVKVAWEIIALPITLRIVRRIKAIENEDFYDRNTDFNPFHVK